jgi:hypothetical protein
MYLYGILWYPTFLSKLGRSSYFIFDSISSVSFVVTLLFAAVLLFPLLCETGAFVPKLLHPNRILLAIFTDKFVHRGISLT